MEKKTWPILPRILIGVGCVGGLAGIIKGLLQHGFIEFVFGAAGLIIYWSLYQFKRWALMALNVLLSLDMILLVIAMLGGLLVAVGLAGIAIKGVIMYYFNMQGIKDMLSD
jgi:hypothetical protein